MALKSTIFKAALQVADMERGYYADHSLTIARHPSETDERMMLRVLAFALHADDRRACGRAHEVVVYTYGRGADLWWSRSRGALERSQNLRVMSVPVVTSQDLAKLAQRTMQLQCTIQDGHVWLGDNDHAVEVALTTVHGPAPA